MTNDLDENIAIVGMAARVPGAHGIEEFRRDLAAGHEAVRFPSDDELPAAALADHDYVRAVMAAPDLDMFDAGVFGLTHQDAAALNPQIRLFPERTHNAVEDPGYDPHRMSGVTIPPDRPVIFALFGLGVLNLAVGRHVYDTLPERGELGSVGGFFREADRQAPDADGAS